MSANHWKDEEWHRFQAAVESAPLGILQADRSYRLIPASTQPIVFPKWDELQHDAALILTAIAKVGSWLARGDKGGRIFSGLAPIEREAAQAAADSNRGLATARLDLFFEQESLWVIEVNTTIPAMQAYSDMVRHALFSAQQIPSRYATQSNSQDLLDSLLDHYMISGGSKSSPRIGIVARAHDSQLAELLWLQRRWEEKGLDVGLFTPDDLTLKNGSLWATDAPLDLCYRHIFAHRLKTGTAFAEACRDSMRYRVFNPISAHMEAKAVLAELSRMAMEETAKDGLHLSPEERDATQRRVLWSRIIRPGASSTFEGQHCSDLPAWLKKNREKLVVKSSQGYGGKSVIIGDQFDSSSTQERLKEIMGRRALASWNEFIDFCLQDSSNLWIAQRKINGKRIEHAFLSQGQRRQAETFIDASIFTASGAVRKPTGGACRFSHDVIVNLGQGGGLIPVLSESEFSATRGFENLLNPSRKPTEFRK